eukprot:TRINITY_DN1902_c0_g3_i1.p1 TRINITY_DN1902_c0_g3~~TRINITY_DN1902_c0_g3_i1.p1  ORF type:complete len:353 (+),score=79.22 TRINITY_DN1902_c0_g3_i1:61-1059(+)
MAAFRSHSAPAVLRRSLPEPEPEPQQQPHSPAPDDDILPSLAPVPDRQVTLDCRPCMSSPGMSDSTQQCATPPASASRMVSDVAQMSEVSVPTPLLEPCGGCPGCVQQSSSPLQPLQPLQPLPQHLPPLQPIQPSYSDWHWDSASRSPQADSTDQGFCTCCEDADGRCSAAYQRFLAGSAAPTPDGSPAPTESVQADARRSLSCSWGDWAIEPSPHRPSDPARSPCSGEPVWRQAAVQPCRRSPPTTYGHSSTPWRAAPVPAGPPIWRPPGQRRRQRREGGGHTPRSDRQNRRSPRGSLRSPLTPKSPITGSSSPAFIVPVAQSTPDFASRS